jgi:hypothetical protein
MDSLQACWVDRRIALDGNLLHSGHTRKLLYVASETDNLCRMQCMQTATQQSQWKVTACECAKFELHSLHEDGTTMLGVKQFLLADLSGHDISERLVNGRSALKPEIRKLFARSHTFEG